MKHLEIQLKKKLHIVEIPFNLLFKVHYGYLILDSTPQGILSKQNKISNGDTNGFLRLGEVRYICKGNELEKDELDSFLEGMYEDYYILNTGISQLYKSGIASYVGCPLSAFKARLKDQGYYWGENPIRPFSLYDPRSKTGWHEKWEEDQINKEYNEAQSKTFILDKTILFEEVENTTIYYERNNQ